VVGAADAGYDLMRLIAFGDAAMYEAKRGGRNRVIAHAPLTSDT
jgi:PleD family two-component response regulator